MEQKIKKQTEIQKKRNGAELNEKEKVKKIREEEEESFKEKRS